MKRLFFTMLCALAFVACSEKTAEEKIAEKVATYYTTMLKGDFEACVNTFEASDRVDLLNEPVAREVFESQEYRDYVKICEGFEIVSIDIRDDFAGVEVGFTNGEGEYLLLVNVDNDWFVTAGNPQD
ncbi:MAG: hypothetical protein R3Y38_07720 [Rikenellaceae bacterium]